ncbi:hypothetical protein PG993_015260 [Apiospora rasikravindrae]|uniref:Uncharacterized protein n=1 Tax=Apiospora rasikravindrae TaxID=990691 RepID=A0ABR1RQ30_9PEZI
MSYRYRQYASSLTTSAGHCTIPCRRSFTETTAALEAAVPLLDRTYQSHLDVGDLVAAGEALQKLPTLNRFGAQPRNFGPILQATAAAAAATPRQGDETNGSNSISSSTAHPATAMIKEALQYEIGNPHKAAQMVRLRGQTALYAPIRVALLRGCLISSSTGRVISERVWFEYDRPSHTMGNTGVRGVDGIARGLDEALHEVLVKAAGLGPETGGVGSKI